MYSRRPERRSQPTISWRSSVSVSGVTAAGLEVEPVQASASLAAGAAREHQVAALARLVARLGDRVGEVGQLPRLGQRPGDGEQLRRVGAAAAVRDQHLLAQRVPVDEGVAAEVGVAGDGAATLVGTGGTPDHEGRIGSDDVSRRAR